MSIHLLTKAHWSDLSRGTCCKEVRSGSKLVDMCVRPRMCARGSRLQLQTEGGVTLRVSERHILPAIKVESERDLRCLDNEPHLNY